MDVIQMQVAFFSRHFEASLDFYGTLLGMREETRWDRADGKGVIFSTGVGAAVEIFGAPDGQENNVEPPRNVSIVFLVEDVDAWYARLAQRTQQFTRPLEQTHWGGRIFGILDPDGNPVEFYSYIGRNKSEEAS